MLKYKVNLECVLLGQNESFVILIHIDHSEPTKPSSVEIHTIDIFYLYFIVVSKIPQCGLKAADIWHSRYDFSRRVNLKVHMVHKMHR